MKTPSSGTSDISDLIVQFENKDPAIRMHAREVLVQLDEKAVPKLVEALRDKNDYVRWEAAKTLKEINSPKAAEALVELLHDEIQAISWAAAEALIMLGVPAVRPLLLGLERHAHSIWFRHSAYHVLHALSRDGKLPQAAENVLHTLRQVEPGITVPFAAKKAIDELDKR